MSEDPFGGDEERPAEFDPDWQQFLISQLPAEVREKFEDPRAAEQYFMRIDRDIRKLGLVFKDAKLAVSPTDNKAYIQITAEIDPAEDAYQMDKQLRTMMYDTEEDEMQRKLEEIKREYGLNEETPE